MLLADGAYGNPGWHDQSVPAIAQRNSKPPRCPEYPPGATASIGQLGGPMCFRPAAIEVPHKCPECGTLNPPTNKKCRSCGISLDHVIADNIADGEFASAPSAAQASLTAAALGAVPAMPPIMKPPGAMAAPVPARVPTPAPTPAGTPTGTYAGTPTGTPTPAPATPTPAPTPMPAQTPLPSPSQAPTREEQ